MRSHSISLYCLLDATLRIGTGCYTVSTPMYVELVSAVLLLFVLPGRGRYSLRSDIHLHTLL